MPAAGSLMLVCSHRALLQRLHASGIQRDEVVIGPLAVPRFTGEFWTARQRQASRLHEISYRACFKPQLPRFFIEALTQPGATVYDPFSGRGTTALEAGLLSRRPVANDVNPLSAILSRPRFSPPDPEALKERLRAIPFRGGVRATQDLSMFFHRETEAELISLRRYLLRRANAGTEDDLDRWIRMIATNRLTGHSKGFFSVYTLPPNQAVTPERQKLINRRLRQRPDYRDVRAIILRKTVSMLRGLTEEQCRTLAAAEGTARFLTGDARKTHAIRRETVHLTVTSPPFLNIVDYASDNWLRCWFNGLDAARISRHITIPHSLTEWTVVMSDVFRELVRITATGGWVAFEVGEVRNRSLRLDEIVAPLGVGAGFACRAILINRQKFTKTSNIWGVTNNTRGTNSNRIVLFQKD